MLTDMQDYKNIWKISKRIYLQLNSYNLLNVSFIIFYFLSMTSVSRQRILNSLGTFRPAFRNVAQSLTDIDLVLVEENFERLLLV